MEDAVKVIINNGALGAVVVILGGYVLRKDQQLQELHKKVYELNAEWVKVSVGFKTTLDSLVELVKNRK